MIDTISIAGQEHELSPLDIWEATELLFVFKPYIHLFDGESDVYEFVKRFATEAQEKGPHDPFRVLAFMYHADADSFISEITTGEEILEALTTGLVFHEVKTLMEFGSLLGISAGEEDAD